MIERHQMYQTNIDSIAYNNSIRESLSNLNRDAYSSYIQGKEVVLEYPPRLIIELTNSCNLDCYFCPRKKMDRVLGFMSTGLFRKIIDEVAGKTDLIWLHFFGESFLHPNIMSLIDYAAGKGTSIGVSTNLTLINKDVCRQLFESKLDFLIVSIDSLDKKEYEKSRIGSSYSSFISNLYNLLDMKRNHPENPTITLQFINLPETNQDINKIYEKIVGIKGLSITIKDFYTFANQMEEFQEYVIEDTLKEMCTEPWCTMGIYWDGTIVPCCNDYNGLCNLGRIEEKTRLFDLWNSSRMKNFRLKMVKKQFRNLSLCKKCNFPSEVHVNNSIMSSRFFPSFSELNYYYNIGIYPMEYYEDESFFWTKKDFELLVQDRKGFIQINFCNNSPFEKVCIDVYLYDEYIKRIEIQKSYTLELFTPQKWEKKLLRYSFTLDKSFNPSQMDINNDNRELGVTIRGICN